MKQINKSKQVGVRFRLDLLEAMKEDGLATTPQQVLNYLTQFYCENNPASKELLATIDNSKLFNLRKRKSVSDFKPVLEPIIEKEGNRKGNKVIVKPDVLDVGQIKALPKRLPGESGIDYKIRCSGG